MGVQDIVDAIPTSVSGEDVDGDALRTALINGEVGYIDGATSVVGGVLQVDPVDADLGGMRKAYVYGPDAGTFVYDPLDETTAHDGIYCIVLIGGKRYKRVGTPTVRSVISRNFTSPPDPDSSPSGSREFGDAYLVISGAAWASEGIATNQIAVWSSLGGGSWQGVDPDYGPPLYVQDEDGYVRWVGMSGWLDGVGNGSYADASIPPSAFIWDNRVQNQTTNSPPSSWSKGVAYIVGSSATGDWSGDAGKIALAESDGVLADGDTFIIIPPYVGQQVYDISLGYRVSWNGSAWVSAQGGVLRSKTTGITASGSLGTPSGNNLTTYSSSSGPSLTSRRYTKDNVTLPYQALTSGNKLRFRYRAALGLATNGVSSPAPSSAAVIAALYRDSETSPLDWVPICEANAASPNRPLFCDIGFEATASDASSHTYSVAIHSGYYDASNVIDAAMTRRVLSVQEIPAA